MNFIRIRSYDFNKSCSVGCQTLKYLKFALRRFSDPGSGAGKGGGAGGSVKESGGGLGRYAAAQEEGFFYNKQQEQIKKLKQKLQSEETSKPQPKQKEDK